VAAPLELVVALCVVVPPVGVVTANVTLAPDAGTPPLVTVAATETVPGRAKFVADTEMLTAIEGGVKTVAFAVPVPLVELFAAFKFTA
jgi:hypothetical protein